MKKNIIDDVINQNIESVKNSSVPDSMKITCLTIWRQAKRKRTMSSVVAAISMVSCVMS